MADIGKALRLGLFLALLAARVGAQQWASQPSGTTVRLRGVSAVSASVAWASGDKGTYARTVDGGRSWQAAIVPGAEALDFRDVDAFDAETAYLLAIGAGDKSRIYKTVDGGRHWALQFQNRDAAAFYDAMAFWDKNHGIALSDPVGGHFLIITTSDGGATWRQLLHERMPAALPGEGAFAASGTCIAVEGTSNVWFGTGGERPRVFRSNDRGRTWMVSDAPIHGGKAAGVFSVAFRDARHGVIGGGDYTSERDAKDNVALTSDGGRTWRRPRGTRPDGYRSCVAILRGGLKRHALIAVGPTGADYSPDDGETWTSLGAQGFHSTSFAAREFAGWAVGEGGRIAFYSGTLRARSER